MFGVIAATASYVSGVSVCDDQSVMRQLAIFSFALVVLVVSMAWLFNLGSRE